MDGKLASAFAQFQTLRAQAFEHNKAKYFAFPCLVGRRLPSGAFLYMCRSRHSFFESNEKKTGSILSIRQYHEAIFRDEPVRVLLDIDFNYVEVGCVSEAEKATNQAHHFREGEALRVSIQREFERRVQERLKEQWWPNVDGELPDVEEEGLDEASLLEDRFRFIVLDSYSEERYSVHIVYPNLWFEDPGMLYEILTEPGPIHPALDVTKLPLGVKSGYVSRSKLPVPMRLVYSYRHKPHPYDHRSALLPRQPPPAPPPQQQQQQQQQQPSSATSSSSSGRHDVFAFQEWFESRDYRPLSVRPPIPCADTDPYDRKLFMDCCVSIGLADPPRNPNLIFSRDRPGYIRPSGVPNRALKLSTAAANRGHGTSPPVHPYVREKCLAGARSVLDLLEILYGPISASSFNVWGMNEWECVISPPLFCPNRYERTTVEVIQHAQEARAEEEAAAAAAATATSATNTTTTMTTAASPAKTLPPPPSSRTPYTLSVAEKNQAPGGFHTSENMYLGMNQSFGVYQYCPDPLCRRRVYFPHDFREVFSLGVELVAHEPRKRFFGNDVVRNNANFLYMV